MQKVFKPLITKDRKTIKKIKQQLESMEDPTLITEKYMDHTKLNETLAELNIDPELYQVAYKVVDAIFNDEKVPYNIGGYAGLSEAKQKVIRLLEA